PISSPNVKNVIAVGLNGTDMSSVYKDSFVNLGIDDDFSHPEYITCMIEQLYRGEQNPTMICSIGTSASPATIESETPFTGSTVTSGTSETE
ncbi:hypothetical protein PMAYCL1PPCAC_04253, partial [Pristionchus mayeri]